MKYFATKLSDNMGETREGFLLCLNVPIGRIGDMEYGRGETPIEVGENGIALISREADEIFSDKTIGSFQGKPVTIRHPEDFVDPKNWKELAVGVMQNVRRGEGEFKDSLVSDLLITDAFAISLVKNGLREVSCGYECEYTPTGEGKGKQTNIVGNHLALVEQGRAGSEYAVRDHKGASQMDKKFLERLKNMLLKSKTVDADIIDKAMKDAESAPSESSPAVMDEKMYDDLMKMCKDLGEKIEAMGKKGKDEEKPAPKKDDEKNEDEDGEGEDDDSSLEERLKKLEVAVSKLLEAKSGDEEEEKSEDDESEIIEDDENESEDESEEESEDEEAEATGDEKSRAEILAPGIKITKDVKRKALKTAYATKDGKEAIDMLTGGKKTNFEKITEDQVEVLFVGTSEMLKSKRSGELARSKRGHVTGDSFQSSIFEQDGEMTPEKMNELNKKVYNLK